MAVHIVMWDAKYSVVYIQWHTTEYLASHMTMCAAMIKNLQTVSLSLSKNDFNVTNTL